MQRPSLSIRPGRIALVYVVASSAWIAASDMVVNQVLHRPGLHVVKGFGFVAVTGLLLYSLLFRMQRSLERGEREQRLTEDRFRMLVESAPEGIFFQTRGIIRYANPAALKIWGATGLRQIEGLDVSSLVPAAYAEEVRQRMRVVHDEERAVPAMEYQHHRLDRSLVDVEVVAVPAEYYGERGALVFFRDITERKRAEAEGRLLEEQFRQAQKMESIGRLAGGIAHDFNNYLTVINGYSELVLRALPPDSPHRAALRQVTLAGERASSLTRQLLTFSRREAAEVVVFDLNGSIQATEKMLHRVLREDIHLELTLEQRPCLVRADHGWIGQVLMNLAVNSRDSMPGGGTVTIRTRIAEVSSDAADSHLGSRPGRFVVLEVEDTGSGMDPEVRKHLFEPFYTTKRQGEGTGLGLSTVYGIVRQCGGWIDVSTEVGRGTKMSVFFPAQDASAGSGTPSPDPEPMAGSRETILVVEDRPDVRDFVVQSLLGHNYDVLPAEGGRDALRLASHRQPGIALLLTDVVMPDMSGVELAQQIRQLHPETRVLLMSGFAGGLLDHNVEGLAGVACLRKPFSVETLLRRVSESIRGPLPAPPA